MSIIYILGSVAGLPAQRNSCPKVGNLLGPESIWMSHDVPTDIGRYLGCDQIQELAESFGKPCLTATMQHGRISLPHSGTSVTAFQALRDLDSLRLNTQARISLWLQYATGNLRDIMSVWLVWGKVLFTAVAQGMCYTGVEPGILVEGGAWRGQGVDYRPQVRRFVSTDAGDVTQLSQPSFESLADASALRCPCNLRYPCNTMVLRLTVSDPKKGS